MHIDFSADREMQNAFRRVDPPQQRPRSTWMHLLSAVLELAQGRGELLCHAERPWASATFSGTRHTITLTFSGAEAVAVGERFIAALPDHEFNIPRQLVADATIAETAHTLLPEPRLTMEAELLLLDDY
jgi:hypothetical protein